MSDLGQIRLAGREISRALRVAERDVAPLPEDLNRKTKRRRSRWDYMLRRYFHAARLLAAAGLREKFDFATQETLDAQEEK